MNSTAPIQQSPSNPRAHIEANGFPKPRLKQEEIRALVDKIIEGNDDNQARAFIAFIERLNKIESPLERDEATAMASRCAFESTLRFSQATREFIEQSCAAFA